MKEFAPQEIWDNEYKGIKNSLDQWVDENDKVSLLLEDFLKDHPGNGKSVFEIGCFPGSYLFHFGRHGYQLNGVDITDEMDQSFTEWLQSKGYKVGDILKEDVFKFRPSRQYDIVCSFGFIEHFSNFDELIEKHIEWTATGGHVIITVPDFSNPVQKFFHSTADQKLLSIHNLKAMNMKAWESVLKKHNVQVIFKGHFGGYAFWAGVQKRNILQKLIVKIGYTSHNILSKRLRKSSSLYSPFMGVILKKV